MALLAQRLKKRQNGANLAEMDPTEGAQVPSTSQPLRPLLSVKSACEILAVSRNTVYKLVRSGDLPGVRVGGDWRFQPDAIEAYIERNRAGAVE